MPRIDNLERMDLLYKEYLPRCRIVDDFVQSDNIGMLQSLHHSDLLFDAVVGHLHLPRC